MDLKDPVLSAYEREYLDSAADWRQLETKIAATVVMGGAFLAALIALIGKPLGTADWIALLVVCLALLSLFAGIFTAVAALRTQELQLPPGGNTVATLLAEGARRSFDTEALRRIVVIRALRLHWFRATSELQAGNQRKGAALIIAQRLILLGGLLAATFGILRLLVSSPGLTG